MNSTIKGPDRLNITKKTKSIVEKIDSNSYMGLKSPFTTRSELFAFAMAIGIETVPTKLVNIQPGGMVLDSSIDNRTRALMYAYFIGKLTNVDMLDDVTNKIDVYNIAQEYANTGFEIIEDYVNTKKDSDLIWDLFEELDEQYNEIIN